jgi:hypothetical protein
MGALSACCVADYRLVIYPCDFHKADVGAGSDR